ncbi:MAG: hypothetical protein WAK69_04280 [Rhodoplanes sp.]
MTTAAQVKKLVRPLLERRADLTLVGRWIFVKPVHHFARAVLIDRMLNPDKFRPQWAVRHLFEARKSFPLDWGEWLYNESSPAPGSWKITDPDISSALINAIEQQALPRLHAIKTLDDYLAFVSRHMFRHKLFDWPQCKIIVDVALGDLDAARALCKNYLPRWSVDQPNYDEDDRAENRRLRELCARLAENDRAGLAQLLHEWEAYTVKNFKIEHLWEPSPFPLERAA